MAEVFCRRQNLEPARIHFLPVGEISARNQKETHLFSQMCFFLERKTRLDSLPCPRKSGRFSGAGPSWIEKIRVTPGFCGGGIEFEGKK